VVGWQPAKDTHVVSELRGCAFAFALADSHPNEPETHYRLMKKAILSGVLVCSSLVLTAFTVSTAQTVDDAEMPQWFIESMEEATAGTGRWIADNEAYQSDDEPWDAYGLEWTWGIGNKSLKGRLFVLQDGEDRGTIWEFRQIWHPGEQKAYLYQYGSDGTVGIGTLRHLGGDKTESVQNFVSPDGSTFQVGHRSEQKDGEDHSRSFNILEDGTWEARRSYVWKRES